MITHDTKHCYFRNHDADEEFKKLTNFISMKSNTFARLKCARRKGQTCHTEPTKFALCFLEAGQILGAYFKFSSFKQNVQMRYVFKLNLLTHTKL